MLRPLPPPFFGKAGLLCLFCLIYLALPAQVLVSLQDVPAPAAQRQAASRPLKEVLSELKTRYDAHFLYDNSVSDSQPTTFRTSTRESLEKQLIRLLRPMGLKFKKIQSNLYVVIPQNASFETIAVPPASVPQPGNTGELGGIDRLGANPLPAPPASPLVAAISGRVVDEKQDGLPGVNVLLKGTSIGTITNAEGRYTLSVPEAGATGTLVFSFIGYYTREVPIGAQSEINVTLAADVKSLGEVVVVGYGTQRKRDVTGAIASVKAEDIQIAAPASLDAALQGQVSGVQVSLVSGAPGAGVSIRIRGGNSINAANEPLYVVDGFPLNNDGVSVGGSGNDINPLAAINPADIESIEILKDASATAIYGARGANGVVLITTKRGKAGRTNIDFDWYTGVDQIGRFQPQLTLQQQIEMQNEGDLNTNGQPSWWKREIDSVYAQMGTTGTQWQDLIMRNGIKSNYNLTASGGTEALRYAVSANYFNQDGVVKESGFKRYSFRTNLDAQLTPKLQMGLNLLFSHTYTQIQNSSGNNMDNVVMFATRKQPYAPIYVTEENKWLWPGQPNLQTGGYAPTHPLEGGSMANPLSELYATRNNGRVNRGLANVFADYTLLEGLRLRTSLGVDVMVAKRDFFQSSMSAAAAAVGGNAELHQSTAYNILNENTLNYAKVIGPHSLNLLGGFTWQVDNRDAFSAQAHRFVSDAYEYNNIDAGLDYRRPFSSASKSSLASFVVRSNYIFRDKYLLTFTARADGSSRFGPNNKWGYFPSGAISWQLGEEPFVKNLNLFTELKPRLSYGVTGNQEIGLYRSLSSYGSGVYPLDSRSLSSGVFINSVGNDDLKWEKTAQWNAGLDVGLLGGRLMITADYYRKRTNDLLLEVDMPNHTGISSVLRNVGAVSNEGIELSVNTVNVDRGKFRWSTDFNWSANKNRVVDLYNTNKIIKTVNLGNSFTVYTVIKEGAPLGAFWGPTFEGIYQSQDELDYGDHAPTGLRSVGTQRYQDVNGDGVFNSDDYGVIGFATPKFIYGVTNNFSYGPFYLRLFLNGVYGNDILNVNRVEGEDMFPDHHAYATTMNRWQRSNPSNTMPAAGRNYQRGFVSSQHLEDGSYLRVRNVTLGYTLPAGTVGWMRRARVYLAVDNIYTFTDYTGYDPEVNSYGNGWFRGIDLNGYPMPRSYRVGLELGF